MYLHITPSFNIDRLCTTASVLLFLVLLQIIRILSCNMFTNIVIQTMLTTNAFQYCFWIKSGKEKIFDYCLYKTYSENAYGWLVAVSRLYYRNMCVQKIHCVFMYRNQKYERTGTPRVKLDHFRKFSYFLWRARFRTIQYQPCQPKHVPSTHLRKCKVILAGC